MRCAIYCRLSREDEDRLVESESIQNQKALLTHYAREQGWEVFCIYCDEDYSGADRNRPEFSRMIKAAKERQFDLILCKTQSRFTRDMELVERYIHGLFPLWGIRFIAIADHIDTSLQGNKKARQINGLVNEWYLEDLSENIRMVFNHKRRQGQYIGGFPLYGYQKHPTEKGRLIIDEEAALVVRQIFRWALEGHGKQKIAKMLNEKKIPNPSRYKKDCGSGYRNGSMVDTRGLWNRSSVGRILHNEMYLGNMVQGKLRKLSYKSHKLLPVPPAEWFRVEGTHEAIIDAECFAAVQALHKVRSKSSGDGEVHPLSGLVRCMSCGSTLQKNAYTYGGVKHSYLRCTNPDCPWRREHETACSIRLEALLLLVEAKVRSYAKAWYHPEAVPLQQAARPSSRFQKELSTLTAQLEQRKRAFEALYLDKASGLISPQQFLTLSQSIYEDLERLEKRAAFYEKQLESPECCEHEESGVTLFQALFHRPVPRAMYLLLIQSIEVEGKPKGSREQHITLCWRF